MTRRETEHPGDDEASAELLRRARDGDEQALGRLVERQLPRLRRWANGRLPRWAREVVDTDDMIQETLLKTLTLVDRFEPRGDGALQAYMRQALRNRIADELRRAGRRPPREAIDSLEPTRDASPLEETLGRETLEAYERGLARLDEHERQAVVARIELGVDYDELARMLGKPSRDAARMAVSRALVALAREMGHER